MHEKYAAGPQSALVLLETFSEQHGGDARQLWEALRRMRWGLEEEGADGIPKTSTPPPADAKRAAPDACVDPDCDGLHGRKRLPAGKRKACRDEYAELERARHLLMGFWRNVFLWAREGRLPASVADPDGAVQLQGVWLYRANWFRITVEPLEILLNSMQGREALPYWPHDAPYELTVQRDVLQLRSKMFGKIERQWLVQQWRDQQKQLASGSLGAVKLPVDDGAKFSESNPLKSPPAQVLKFASSLNWARQIHKRLVAHGHRACRCQLHFHGPGIQMCDLPLEDAMRQAGLLVPVELRKA